LLSGDAGQGGDVDRKLLELGLKRAQARFDGHGQLRQAHVT
jgi:hypothetical protein